MYESTTKGNRIRIIAKQTEFKAGAVFRIIRAYESGGKICCDLEYTAKE